MGVLGACSNVCGGRQGGSLSVYSQELAVKQRLVRGNHDQGDLKENRSYYTLKLAFTFLVSCSVTCTHVNR